MIKERVNKISIPELIREAVVYRLKLLHPYMDKWPEVSLFNEIIIIITSFYKRVKAMAVMSFNPSYAIESIQNLLELCDEIWHQAGDKSADVCSKIKMG